MVQPGTPYYTVQALAAWAERRKGYVRGRALLAGQDVERLQEDGAAFIDFVEAVAFESTVHSGGSIDEALDKFFTRVMEEVAPILVAQGRGEDVFDTPEWRARAEAFERMHPPSVTEEELLGGGVPQDDDNNPF